MNPHPLPRRRKLPHDVPSWVQQGARHFITVNCKARDAAPLLQNNIASELLTSARFYEETNRWYLWLMLVMPDHVHFILTFDLSKGIRDTVSAWKRFQAKSLGVSWQKDFFEHRLRDDQAFREKAAYIRLNPVRKELVEKPEEWEYLLDRTPIGDKV